MSKRRIVRPRENEASFRKERMLNENLMHT